MSERRGVNVLCKKITEDWGLNQEESGLLLCKAGGHRNIIRIAADLDELFQDVEAVRSWLNEAQTDLGEKTPRALLTDGSMESLMAVTDYVAHLSGR